MITTFEYFGGQLTVKVDRTHWSEDLLEWFDTVLDQMEEQERMADFDRSEDEVSMTEEDI